MKEIDLTRDNRTSVGTPRHPYPRVLHIAPALFGEGDEFFGGGERYVYELARAMSRLVPTTLLTFGRHRSRRRDQLLRVEITTNWLYYRRFRFDPFNPLVAIQIKKADVVHYHQTYTIMSGVSALMAKFFRKPIFTTDAGAGGYGFHRLVDTRDWYNGHLHISNFSRRHFGHVDRKDARVIHGGVDPEKFRPDRLEQRSGEVLFVGRLLPHKGVNYLIEAVDSRTPLRIIGRPFRHAKEYYELLKTLAQGKQVVFETNCSDDGLIKAYRRALCIVLPSVHVSIHGDQHVIPELLGLTALEAMACETPAICTNVTSLSEIVEDGITGFLAPPNDPGALNERICWLRDHPAEAARMGQAARKRVLDRFTWENAATECLEAYAALG